ncbi:NAD kinase [Ordospora colligata]|uniref:NAD kinase n=1 Tax=Ordospora colligata OC4 TaxID=1354746 RepID=A0A0B2UJH0_9MICR|nr:NAD kinase [Ordospora colligata OC4]KHN69369.1 NAD kinase [Ordospora colligata OC4]TBU14883.1 NAD kinase [Ordospora colligata]TBU15014.1 NAD kinase [Ordospora colligata]TBU18268.1 NAD kinase [Ordospora colligata]
MGLFLLVVRDSENTEVVEHVRSALDCDVVDKRIGYDGIIVIGGDGSVLRAVSCYDDPPIIYAVNRGKVGFLCPIPYDKLDVLLYKLVSGEQISMKQSIRLCFVGKRHFLNEAIIRSQVPRLNTFRICINSVSFILRGDAVIVSTRTGSSGYNASADGPLLLMDGIVINVVAPNRCAFRPIVCSIESKISIEIDSDPQVILDGIVYEEAGSHERMFDIFYNGSMVRFGYLNDYDESRQIEGLFMLNAGPVLSLE